MILSFVFLNLPTKIRELGKDSVPLGEFAACLGKVGAQVSTAVEKSLFEILPTVHLSPVTCQISLFF